MRLKLWKKKGTKDTIPRSRYLVTLLDLCFLRLCAYVRVCVYFVHLSTLLSVSQSAPGGLALWYTGTNSRCAATACFWFCVMYGTNGRWREGGGGLLGVVKITK